MPKSIATFLVIGLAILLALIALTPVVVMLHCWIGGIVFGLTDLFLNYHYKIKKKILRENLPGAVSFSVLGSNLHWQPRNDSKTKKFDSEIIQPSLIGAAFAAAIGYFEYSDTHPSRKAIFWIAVFLGTLCVPLSLVLLNPRKFYEWRLIKRARPIIGAQDSTIDGMDELRAHQLSASKLAEKLKIRFAGNSVAQVGQYVQDHQTELLFERTALSQFVAERSRLLVSEMSAFQGRANGGSGRASSSETGAASNRMTKEQALKILGLPSSATFADVKSARMEAVKKFNVDHRQDLEPHIRDLVEERFKQVNTAFDLLKAEFQAA
jgi:hypothetical protein